LPIAIENYIAWWVRRVTTHRSRLGIEDPLVDQLSRRGTNIDGNGEREVPGGFTRRTKPRSIFFFLKWDLYRDHE